MRDVFLNNSLKLLCSNYNYDNDTLDMIKYGLETIYISITKLSVIIIISIIFGLIKETLLTILFVNGIRKFAYGMHAKKSWQCYILSISIFIIFPYCFRYLHFDYFEKTIISLFSLISFILYAPADTHKRPLVNEKHRKKLKISTLIVCMIYILIIFLLNDELINNMIILSMIIGAVVINPIIYKLFNMSYKNYMTYNSK